jgi:hypothetical protein
MPQGPQINTLGNIKSSFILSVNIGTPGAVTLSQTGTTTVNVPGLLPTDQITVGKPTIQAGLAVVAGVCLTPGVLTVQYMNASVGNITPTANEIYSVEVNRPEVGFVMPGIQ